MRAATACSERREAPGQPDKLERWNGLGPRHARLVGLVLLTGRPSKSRVSPLHYGIAARKVARNEANGGRSWAYAQAY